MASHSGSTTTMHPDEYAIILEEAEKGLDRLRALYEQYFQGFERLEPHVPRKKLERSLARLRKAPQRNTALRFRYNRLVQKFTTYQAYWRRVGRQIEEGTYLRHVMRARDKRKQAQARMSEAPSAFEIDVDVDLDIAALTDAAAASIDKKSKPSTPAGRIFGDTDVKDALNVLSPMPTIAPETLRQPRRASLSPFAMNSKAPPPSTETRTDALPTQHVATPVPATVVKSAAQGAYKPPVPSSLSGAPAMSAKTLRRRTPVPPGKQTHPRSIAGNTDVNMRRVFDRYVAARKQNNERTDNVRYESLERNIQKMMPKLRQKHAGKKIDFEVVIKNGRVGLKPVAKK